MAPLKLHLNKVNSYWKWLSGKLNLKSSSIVVSLGFKNRIQVLGEEGGYYRLSIRIDRALETFYLFIIRECVDVSCMYHRCNKMEEGWAGSGRIGSERSRIRIYINAERLSGM